MDELRRFLETDPNKIRRNTEKRDLSFLFGLLAQEDKTGFLRFWQRKIRLFSWPQ